MKDIDVPPLVPPTTEGNLSDLPERNAKADPDRVVFATRAGAGFNDVTATEFYTQVRALAKGLLAAGIEVGDRVGLMSKTRYEWTVADFAIWAAGAVVVPIYETSSAEQISWILQDSAAVALIVETPGHASTLAEVRDELGGLRDVWQIDAGGLDEVAATGADVSDETLDARRAGVTRADLATIIYTSGATGRPKGCELTHDNFMALSENACERLTQVVHQPGAATVLFLPLAHVFARFIEVLCVDAMVKTLHTPDTTNLLEDLGSFKPTFVLAVPRVFEKIYNASGLKATASGKGKIFNWAARTAIAYSKGLDSGGPSIGVKVGHAVADKLVYAKLRDAMGGNVRYAVSGGAALGERLGHFYRGLGLVVLEGYGLTETTAPATVNTPELIKIGTVGPPLPGVAVRVADDGEILIKGNNVFRRYFNNPEATDEAIVDGWFQTGDLGSLDDDGFLRITGRKKEILVTAAGKNVAPAMIEDRLRSHALISQCMVVGDAKPFIAALVTLDAEMVPTWTKSHGLGELSAEEARTNDAVRAEIQEAVDYANRAVSRAESIRKFAVLEGDFTEDNGYLTPSMKLKRDLVLADFGDDVEGLYREAPQQQQA